jgi:hypothetical protein
MLLIVMRMKLTVGMVVSNHTVDSDLANDDAGQTSTAGGWQIFLLWPSPE